MQLRDRIRRWWKPAQWRDNHPEESDGEGVLLSETERIAAQTRLADSSQFVEPGNRRG
jgi:hypothetical protein